MKIECPVCGKMGHIQIRGSNARIMHYKGYEGKKRVYERHAIPKEALAKIGNQSGNQPLEMEINGSKKLEINNLNLGFKWENMARDVGFEPTRPFDHRLSRPAPYQAWGIPHAVPTHNCNELFNI
jgi:hypothetical protein